MTSLPDQNELERKALDWIECLLDDPTQAQIEQYEALRSSNPALYARIAAIADMDTDGALPRTGGAWRALAESVIPATIGDYKVIRELGQGGMGVVYLGHRQSEDFSLEVAIKVVRETAQSERLIARLRAERRTMTHLSHPHIAQIFDGGETEDGDPYLVMEYVEGVRLDTFLEQHDLSLSRRLQMFLDICQAVAYSHQHLIIHRDLSPANILVTADGYVKLIDFGLAHNLEDLEDGVKQSSHLTITEGYGAPERADGVPASTVTDIYSLGAILRDVLGAAAHPQREDLEAITHKALALAPSERYQSVDALTTDIANYLDVKPVAARPSTFTYTLARAIKRHKAAVTVFSVILLGLVIGSAVVTTLYLRATAAEEQAQARFDQVRKIAQLLIFDVHDEISELSGSIPAQKLLIDTALTYLEQLDSSGSGTPELSLEVAQGYQRLNEITGNPYSQNLGGRVEAASLLERATLALEKARRFGLDEAAYLRAHIKLMFSRATQMAFSDGDFSGGYQLLLTARDAFGSLRVLEGKLPLEDRLLSARIDGLLGYLLSFTKDKAGAIAHSRESVEKFRVLRGLYPASTDAESMFYSALAYTAEMLAWEAYLGSGDYDQALALFNESIAGYRQLVTTPTVSHRLKMSYLIALLKRTNTTCHVDGQRTEALSDLDEQVLLTEELITANADDDWSKGHLTAVLAQQAECFRTAGLVGESIGVWQRVTKRRMTNLENSPQNAGYLKEAINGLSEFSKVYEGVGELANACRIGYRLAEVVKAYQQPGVTISPLDQEAFDYNQGLLEKCPPNNPAQN